MSLKTVMIWCALFKLVFVFMLMSRSPQFGNLKKTKQEKHNTIILGEIKYCYTACENTK